MTMMMNKLHGGASVGVVVSTLIFCILFLGSFEIQMVSAHVHASAASAALLRGSASSEMHKLGGALAAQVAPRPPAPLELRSRS